MPWKETCPMDQRVALIADWLRDEWTMTALGAIRISRRGLKWVDRYGADPRGLERSRRHVQAAMRGGREAVLAWARTRMGAEETAGDLRARSGRVAARAPSAICCGESG